MAPSAPSNGKAKDGVRGTKRASTLKAILVLTLVVLTAALGLMIWNSYQARNTQDLKLLQRDVLLVGERFIRRADRAADRLENELRAGIRLTSIDTDFLGVDTVHRLDEALASDTRKIADAGAAAKELSNTGQRLGLLDDGRLVLSYIPTVGSPIVATVDAHRWLPGVGPDSRIVLYGRATVSAGDGTVIPANSRIRERGSGFRFDGPMNRSATACADIHGATFTMCLSRNSPLLTLDMILSLLLNILLVSAPALAIIGLYKQSKAEPVAAALSNSRQTPDTSRVELAAANAGMGFWDVRPGDRTAWVSEEAARLLGRQMGGRIDQAAFVEAFYPNHRDRLQETLADARPNRPFSIDLASATSTGESWIELRGCQVFDTSTGTTIISGVMFDVTDMVRRREKHRTADARLRGAIESFPCPFALWDNKKRLVFWNKAFETIFELSDVLRPGVSQETVLVTRSGKVISEKSNPGDPGTLLLGLRSGEWIKLVERATTSGTIISFGLDVTNDVQNEDKLLKQKTRLKALVQELERSEGHKSELARKYNEEKAKAEKSADSKAAFLANMSHELRTPLNAINGFSEILVNEMYGPLGDERYQGYAADILTSGQHLLDMINDILDIAKIDAGKMTIDPKPIDLVDPVDAAVRMIRRKAEDKGVQVILQADNDLPLIDADHRAVRQMVLNLISNSIKFTDSGGRITIAVQQRDEFLRVAVRDTGIGIPKEHIPRLAKPFEQVQDTRERNFEGTGLGLALTKSFAEMHGGKLTIASEPGKGTLVCFYLPVATDDARRDKFVA
ncbi:MAG: PAS domain-containing sensor histidine kinase [Pseudomonadota bacterium]|nr:PAS domain-containing sensor histidine kinase [Pseudomonadota bacterium]